MNAAPRLRLLIDACLTPACIPQLRSVFRGAVDSIHVDAVLPRGSSDADVLDYATVSARALVTANGADFLALVRARPQHPGVLLVSDQNTRTRQLAAVESLTRAVLDWLDTGPGVDGHVFIMRRRSGRLAARLLP